MPGRGRKRLCSTVKDVRGCKSKVATILQRLESSAVKLNGGMMCREREGGQEFNTDGVRQLECVPCC